MMKLRRPLFALVALALSITPEAALAQQQPAPAPSGQPAAEPETDEGKARFLRGVQLFREGDFRSALVEFRRSFEISKNFKVLYNIGQTEYELSDYAGALRSFRRYLELGGAEVDAARKTQVEEDIKNLGLRVAHVEISCNVAGAEVLVDDVLVGTTPLPEALLVSIGRRKVSVQKGGVVSAPRFVELAGGDRTAVKIELAEPKPTAPVATIAPTTAAPPPVVEEPAPSRTGLWASVGITAGLVVGAAITGGLALSAHEDHKKKLDTFGVAASDLDSARSSKQTLALVTDILGGAAIAMTAVTVVVAVTGGKSDPAKRSAAVGLGPRGLVIHGAF